MEHIIIALTQGLRPHGRSGLKLPYIGSADLGDMSPPTRAEWIEIDYLYRTGGMMKVSLISIHAPAWGATKINVDRIFILIFQSTHPRGVRRLRLLLHLALCNISIHAPAWGATECGQRIVYPEKYFNPRTRVGCDLRHK